MISVESDCMHPSLVSIKHLSVFFPKGGQWYTQAWEDTSCPTFLNSREFKLPYISQLTGICKSTSTAPNIPIPDQKFKGDV